MSETGDTQLTVEERAYHEAGHAVACCWLSIAFSTVKVHGQPQGGSGGHTLVTENWRKDFATLDEATRRRVVSEADRRRAFERLTMGYAGGSALRRHLVLSGAADDRLLAHKLEETSQHDVREGQAILAHIYFGTPDGEQRFGESAQAESEAFVSEHWAGIARVAIALADHRELTSEEVRGFLGATWEAPHGT
jgi:hypothetical protein